VERPREDVERLLLFVVVVVREGEFLARVGGVAIDRHLREPSEVGERAARTGAVGVRVDFVRIDGVITHTNPESAGRQKSNRRGRR
jgi:hypothetical protein